MPGVGDRRRQRIAKHGARLHERDTVLPKVADLLLRVPFEFHPRSIPGKRGTGAFSPRTTSCLRDGPGGMLSLSPQKCVVTDTTARPEVVHELGRGVSESGCSRYSLVHHPMRWIIATLPYRRACKAVTEELAVRHFVTARLQPCYYQAINQGYAMSYLPSLSLPPLQHWQDFEGLCCDLWRRIWNNSEIQKNGRGGQAQKGVDISGRPDHGSEWAGVQCKLRNHGHLSRKRSRRR